MKYLKGLNESLISCDSRGTVGRPLTGVGIVIPNCGGMSECWADLGNIFNPKLLPMAKHISL